MTSIEKVISYPTNTYDFSGILKKIFGMAAESDLRFAHKIINNSENWEQITFDKDTSTDFHKLYYKSEKYNEMIELYHRFIQEYLLPLIGEEDEYIVQKEPSFRIHIPNNTALGKIENDNNEMIGMHCDGDYNHPSSEINYMLTLTGQEDTNSCYVESMPGKGDFHPINIKYGEIFQFYGNKCRHYNKKNITSYSRISFDFRLIPASKYKEDNGTAIHSGRRFTVGGYYIRINRKSGIVDV